MENVTRSRSSALSPLPLRHSFPPVVDSAVHTIILGSMPGRLSLTHNQYYAHPRNAFWHIMGEFFGAGVDHPYEHRLSLLLKHHIGLWDVIGSCSRTTSLDSDIDEDSIEVNDFDMLLNHCPALKRIYFNGTKAELCFRRYVQPSIQQRLKDIDCHRLTSTSPANARYSLSEKIKIWSNILM